MMDNSIIMFLPSHEKTQKIKSQFFLSTFFTGRGDTWTALLGPRANTDRTPRLDSDLIFHLHDDDNYDVHTIQQQ